MGIGHSKNVLGLLAVKCVLSKVVVTSRPG